VVLWPKSPKHPIQSWWQGATQSKELPDYGASIMILVQRTIWNNRKVILGYILV